MGIFIIKRKRCYRIGIYEVLKKYFGYDCFRQGQDFRPSYLKIVEFISQLKTRPIVSTFTATATEQVKEDMLTVHGVGENKFLKYGERFLAVIAEFGNGVLEKYYVGELEEVEPEITEVSSKNTVSFQSENREGAAVSV